MKVNPFSSESTPKSIQRILHILPPGEEARAEALVERGLHSAVQIANLPLPRFLAEWQAIFPGEEKLGEIVYQKAVARKAFVALHYVRKVQDSEPHYKAARFQ